MTTTQAPPQLDEARIQGFVDQILSDFAGAATTAMTVIGDRLDLYQALTGAGPGTAHALSRSTGLHERLITEWLAAQTVSGYVTYDPVAGTYELPTEHAIALSVADSPAHLVAIAEIVAGQHLMLDGLEHAFRGDGGIDYGTLPRCLHRGVERFFRTAYVNELAATWFPAVDGLVARLEAGARVADVGCGHGQSCLVMAATWPKSTIMGLISTRHPSSRRGRTPSRPETRRTPRSAHRTPATSAQAPSMSSCSSTPSTTWATLRPPFAGLARCWSNAERSSRSSLDRRTAWRTASATSSPVSTTPSPRAVHAWLTGPTRAYGLGNQGGPAKRLELISEAGFRKVTLALDTGFNLMFAATK